MLTPLFGQKGSQLWDQLITAADPKIWMREMRSRIEANSIRKPNKARENQNMQQMAGFLLPVLQWAAQATGDTTPLNNFVDSYGKAIDQETEKWHVPPIQPPQPSPEEIAAMEKEQEMKEAKDVADITHKEMQNKKLSHELLEMGAGGDISILDSVEPDPEMMFEDVVE